METFILAKSGLKAFITELQKNFAVLGPLSRNGEHVFGPITSSEELCLQYDTSILPPHKKYFQPPAEVILQYENAVDCSAPAPVETAKTVLFGVHSCDVNGLLSLDRVFLDSYPDPYYKARRESTVIIGLNCSTPCKNGFCASFNTGPGMDCGFDLALTDIGDSYLVESGSEQGSALAASLPRASDQQLIARNRVLRSAQQAMTRRIDADNLAELLHNNVLHPKWEELKEQCLACGSCTNVCPTCFCFGVKDRVDMSLQSGTRCRSWESCQSFEFSRVAMDHIFRPDRAARIRQRIYHKLSYFDQQFGAPGCTGCGRCVSYCIVNIDPVEIVASIQADPLPARPVQIYRSAGKKICPDKSPWEPQKAVIKAMKRQNADNITYTMVFADPATQAAYKYDPGVFNMISIMGIGEAPISISSSADQKDDFDHTIRAVGNLTNFLEGLKVGDTIGVRGPYGSGWPVEEMKGKNVLLVAGGIGLAPLRPVIKHIQAHRGDVGAFEILYGARSPADMLFTDEFDEWLQIPNMRMAMTVDRVPEGTEWQHGTGVVTTLFNAMQSKPANTVVVTCGPDIMMKFVVKDLLNRGFAPEQVFVSLERRMSCGIKKCGNCQIGPVFVCQDGPVFRYSEVKDLPEEIL